MTLEKGQKIRQGKTYEPSTIAISWILCELVQRITAKSKVALKTEFSRKNLKFTSFEDVKNYIEERYKKKYL